MKMSERYVTWYIKRHNEDTDPFICAMFEWQLPIKKPRAELNELQQAALRYGSERRTILGCFAQLFNVARGHNMITNWETLKDIREEMLAKSKNRYLHFKEHYIKFQESKNHPLPSKAAASHSSPAVDDLP